MVLGTVTNLNYTYGCMYSLTLITENQKKERKSYSVIWNRLRRIVDLSFSRATFKTNFKFCYRITCRFLSGEARKSTPKNCKENEKKMHFPVVNHITQLNSKETIPTQVPLMIHSHKSIFSILNVYSFSLRLYTQDFQESTYKKITYFPSIFQNTIHPFKSKNCNLPSPFGFSLHNRLSLQKPTFFSLEEGI